MYTPRPITWLLPLIACLTCARAQSVTGAPEQDLQTFVRARVADFHQRRIQRLSTLKLDKVLERKNPYLLKAKSLDTPRELVIELLDSPRRVLLELTPVKQISYDGTKLAAALAESRRANREA